MGPSVCIYFSSLIFGLTTENPANPVQYLTTAHSYIHNMRIQCN